MGRAGFGILIGMAKAKKRKKTLPIQYWSHSSLMTYLRNRLAWYKRYVERIYDIPSTPSAIIGRAGHMALEVYYKGESKEAGVAKGLEYLRSVSDFEINFGAATSRKAKRDKRQSMEREYLQAIGFYLARAPRHKVIGVEVRGMAEVEGLPLPVKAISDLVVESKGNPGCLDIVDHKFVDFFTKTKAEKPAFLLQAVFNYYTVQALYGKPVKRFIVYECKKKRNADGKSQLRRYVIDYSEVQEAFLVFKRLIEDATTELSLIGTYLPNPMDMFEGEHSFDLYRLGLVEEETAREL